MTDQLSPTAVTNPLLEFRLAAAEKHILEQTAQIRHLEEEIRENRAYYQQSIQELKDAHELERRSQLKWGISSLGSLVMILIGIVWNYRGAIFKGS